MHNLCPGTFAIVCLMTGKVVTQYSTHEIMQNGTIRNIPEAGEQNANYTNLQVATTVTFSVAMVEVSNELLIIIQFFCNN